MERARRHGSAAERPAERTEEWTGRTDGCGSGSVDGSPDRERIMRRTFFGSGPPARTGPGRLGPARAGPGRPGRPASAPSPDVPSHGAQEPLYKEPTRAADPWPTKSTASPVEVRHPCTGPWTALTSRRPTGCRIYKHGLNKHRRHARAREARPVPGARKAAVVPARVGASDPADYPTPSNLRRPVSALPKWPKVGHRKL